MRQIQNRRLQARKVRLRNLIYSRDDSSPANFFTSLLIHAHMSYSHVFQHYPRAFHAYLRLSALSHVFLDFLTSLHKFVAPVYLSGTNFMVESQCLLGLTSRSVVTTLVSVKHNPASSAIPIVVAASHTTHPIQTCHFSSGPE